MIKSITVKHLQSIRDEVKLEFPESGVVIFAGDNSGGKSIIMKVLSSAIACQYNNKQLRNAHINREHRWGELILETYKNDVLTIHLDREAKFTYYILKSEGKGEVKRYLADKHLDSLIEAFGFHYNKDRDISLNIRRILESMPFVTTSGVTNLDLLNSAAVENAAQTAEKGIGDTLKELKELKTAVSTKLESLKYEYDSLKIINIKELEKYRETLNKLKITILKLKVPLPPKYYEIYKLEVLENFRIPLAPNLIQINNIGDISKLINYPRLPELESLIEVINMIKEKKCPTCGRAIEIGDVNYAG